MAGVKNFEWEPYPKMFFVSGVPGLGVAFEKCGMPGRRLLATTNLRSYGAEQPPLAGVLPRLPNMAVVPPSAHLPSPPDFFCAEQPAVWVPA